MNMKLTMADITNHKNNWAGRLQIQLALSSEFFSFPYKFETTAKILFLIRLSFLYLTWWEFQVKILNSIILMIDYFVLSTAEALNGDLQNIFWHLKTSDWSDCESCLEMSFIDSEKICPYICSFIKWVKLF